MVVSEICARRPEPIICLAAPIQPSREPAARMIVLGSRTDAWNDVRDLQPHSQAFVAQLSEERLTIEESLVVIETQVMGTWERMLNRDH